MERDGSLLFIAAPWEEALPSLRRLRDALVDSGYMAMGRLPLPGRLHDLPLDMGNLLAFLRGQSNLFQISALPGLYRTALRVRNPKAVALHEFFQIGRAMPRERLEELLTGELVEEVLAADLLEAPGGELRSRVIITPFRDRFYVSDPLWLQDHAEFVYMGRTSFAVPELLLKAAVGDERRGRLLDVGCGCGILGIAVADLFEEVVGTDIVGRCLLYAKLNAALNDVNGCDFHYSDVYSDVEGTFDVIVTNPPCEWVDEDQEETKPVYEAGGADWGAELPARILGGALERLNPGGIIYATLSSPVIRGRPHVVEVMERTFGATGADITLIPTIEYYDYSHARSLRRAGISRIVRYLVSIRQASQLTIRFERQMSVRMLSYKVRALAPRLVAALTGGPRPPAR